MGARQTRVFVRSDEPPDGWAETLLGRVMRPLADEFAGAPTWFWFSRYLDAAGDSGDCDVTKIPVECKEPLEEGGHNVHRSLRYRYSIADDAREAFEARALALIP